MPSVLNRKPPRSAPMTPTIRSPIGPKPPPFMICPASHPAQSPMRMNHKISIEVVAPFLCCRRQKNCYEKNAVCFRGKGMFFGPRKVEPITCVQLALGVSRKKNNLPRQTLDSYLPRDAMRREVLSLRKNEADHLHRCRFDQCECSVFRQPIIQLE